MQLFLKCQTIYTDDHDLVHKIWDLWLKYIYSKANDDLVFVAKGRVAIKRSPQAVSENMQIKPPLQVVVSEFFHEFVFLRLSIIESAYTKVAVDTAKALEAKVLDLVSQGKITHDPLIMLAQIKICTRSNELSKALSILANLRNHMLSTGISVKRFDKWSRGRFLVLDAHNMYVTQFSKMLLPKEALGLIDELYKTIKIFNER